MHTRLERIKELRTCSVLAAYCDYLELFLLSIVVRRFLNACCTKPERYLLRLSRAKENATLICQLLHDAYCLVGLSFSRRIVR